MALVSKIPPTVGALPIVLPGAPATAAPDTLVASEDHLDTITFPNTPANNTRVGVHMVASFNNGILHILPGVSDAFVTGVDRELMQYGNAVWQYFAAVNLWLQISGAPLSLQDNVHTVPISWANLNAGAAGSIGVNWGVRDSIGGNTESETRVRVDVTAVNHTDGDTAEAAHWIMEAVYTRDGATVKEESKILLLEQKPGLMSACDFDIVINGLVLELTCTGITAKNLSWNGEGNIRDSVR